jgi:hypothetical protein
LPSRAPDSFAVSAGVLLRRPASSLFKEKEMTSVLNFKSKMVSSTLELRDDSKYIAVFVEKGFDENLYMKPTEFAKILELPTISVWDMLRNNLTITNFSGDEISLLRRKNEALAAERYLKECAKLK